MKVTTELTNELFRDTIDRALTDVFRTMLTFKATAAPGAETDKIDGIPVTHEVKIPDPRVIGTVGFIGDLNGLVSLFITEELSIAIASQLLGMTRDEVIEAGHEVINDTIGEITNMTAGAFKNQLADRGYPCKLTVPSIVRGETLSLEQTRGSLRRIYRYNVEGHILFLDFQQKETSSSTHSPLP